MRAVPIWPPGTVLRARHKGQVVEAVVHQADGHTFRAEYDGQEYTSLSAMGHAVTGGSVNGWKFWQPVGVGTETTSAPQAEVRTRRGRRMLENTQQRPPATEEDDDWVTDEALPDAFRVHDGYVPMQPDEKGSYPTTNPKLGRPPSWFGDAPDCWMAQCSGCDLLVVAMSRGRGYFDDYEGKVPHQCTHRKPGEAVGEATRRLTRLYVHQLRAASRRQDGKAGTAPAAVEEDDRPDAGALDDEPALDEEPLVEEEPELDIEDEEVAI